ncbi:MAG: hypothetical protein JXD19_04910, partial [Deltaproteobacteria bacterium]|nr:hypothetical protein [Deltaproteobacteria bacterium]
MKTVIPSVPRTPLYIIIGTRGQFTKTAPLIRELDSRGIAYTLINTGQHTHSSYEIADIFGIRAGDHFVTNREQDIDKFSHAIFWFVKAFLAFMIRRRKF